MKSRHRILSLRIIELVTRPACQQCDNQTKLERCLKCPIFNVILTEYNDGYGSWVARIESMGVDPVPKHVRFIKFFKTEKLVNSPGFSEVCMVSKVCSLEQSFIECQKIPIVWTVNKEDTGLFRSFLRLP